MRKHHSQLTVIAAACVALALSACGGGGGGGTTASGSTSTVLSTSTVSGTVTGFGSVIVDGVRIDDSTVTATVETENDSTQTAEVEIGQHVEVEHDSNNVAKAIRISSELEGTVTAVDAGAGTLAVLGQTATVNADATLGPVTVFKAPYTGLADIAVNDVVKVHGLVKVDAAGKSSIQATRVEKKISSNANRVRGIVASLSTTAKTFRVGDLVVSYANARITPASRSLKDGDEVSLWIPLNATYTGTAINASKVKIRTLEGVSQDREAKVGGAVSDLDATAKTFTLDGVTVDASQARFVPANKAFADLRDGTYVRVQGTTLADGSLKAATITLRAMEKGSGREVELHGTILNYQSNANFTLRGVQIDASTATISCTGTTALGNNVQVEVEGRLTATGTVVAKEVKCESAQDGQSVVEREGTAGTVDATAKTFVITTENGTVNAKWSATTLFVDVTSETLSGKKVEVEGVMSSGVLVATKVKLDS